MLYLYVIFVLLLLLWLGIVTWTDPHGKEITENMGSTRIYTANSDAGGTSMMFEDVRKKDAGQYVCEYKKVS